nr:hypothetical protein [Alteripontixanthobacter maritimus]
MQTTATRSGNGYVLNGCETLHHQRPVCEDRPDHGAHGEDNQAKNAHVSAFLVEMDTDGIARGKSDKKMGQEGSHIGDLYFDDVKLPGSALLGGEEGRGFATAMQSLDNGRLSVAAASAAMPSASSTAR